MSTLLWTSLTPHLLFKTVCYNKNSNYHHAIRHIMTVGISKYRILLFTGLWFSKRKFLLFCRCHFKNNHPAYKKQRNRSHSDIYLSGKLRDEADHGWFQGKKPLSAYVHKSKIFTWFFRWYDLGKIGSGKQPEFLPETCRPESPWSRTATVLSEISQIRQFQNMLQYRWWSNVLTS